MNDGEKAFASVKQGGKIGTPHLLPSGQLNSLEGLENILEYRVGLNLLNIRYAPLLKELRRAITKQKLPITCPK